MEDKDVQSTMSMTADTIGRDILQVLVQEIKLLPDPWAKLSKAKQDDVIGRLRDRVETSVKMAVHLIAADGRTVVAGDLEQITIKDGVKAVVKFGPNAANLHELYDVAGKAVLLAVANAADHTGGMDEVKGESDQRAMDLGHEYDPKADGQGMASDIVDADFREVPRIGNDPTEEQLKEAFEDGEAAAEEGRPESDCPRMDGRLCIEWVRGWKNWHETHSDDDAAPVLTANLGVPPNENGVYDCDPDETLEWVKQKHSAGIELLELQNGRWLYAVVLSNIDGQYRGGPLTARDSADSREGALRLAQSELVQVYAKGEGCGLKGKAFEEFRAFVDGLVSAPTEGAKEEEETTS